MNKLWTTLNQIFSHQGTYFIAQILTKLAPIR